MIVLRLEISGRVQGVGYRDWAARLARRLGLAGWVRNRSDGSVEALVFGPGERVEAFAEAARTGPPAARVGNVRRSADDPPSETGFHVLPTR